MISCDNYDYIEIACTFKYPVMLILTSGDIITGIATDTVINEQRQECLKLKSDNSELLVVLDEIKMMEALLENPQFKLVAIN